VAEGEQSLNGSIEKLAEEFHLSGRFKRTNAGWFTKVQRPVSRVTTYLKKAGFLESRERGFLISQNVGWRFLRRIHPLLTLIF